MAEAKKKPRVKFIGDPNDNYQGPAKLTMMGHTFAYDRFQDVSDAMLEKARNHSHFLVEGEPDPREEGKDEGEEDEEEPKQYTVGDLRQILDAKQVKYAKNATAQVLMDLVMANGGLPE